MENHKVVPVTIEIQEQRIKDILCNALEGGSNYWYMIERYEYPKGQTKETLKLEFPHNDLPFAGGALIISDCEGDMPEEKLDYKACIKGLSLMAKNHPRHFGDFISENDDATTADVFLQCALYGEVIYG